MFIHIFHFIPVSELRKDTHPGTVALISIKSETGGRGISGGNGVLVMCLFPDALLTASSVTVLGELLPVISPSASSNFFFFGWFSIDCCGWKKKVIFING